MTTTRITVCPRGHRLEIKDTPGEYYEHSICKAVSDTADALCDYCRALVLKQRPVKAKRPGES